MSKKNSIGTNNRIKKIILNPIKILAETTLFNFNLLSNKTNISTIEELIIRVVKKDVKVIYIKDLSASQLEFFLLFLFL
ncbi:hypothetical protein G15_0370 [Enterococcus avium]|nr:hypothetical protein G15_0370 [Enterococcus avium]